MLNNASKQAQKAYMFLWYLIRVILTEKHANLAKGSLLFQHENKLQPNVGHGARKIMTLTSG